MSVILPSGSAAYEEIAVNNGATIRGSVKVEGKLPKPPPLQITKSKEVCRNVPNETLIVGAGQGIRYAIVVKEHPFFSSTDKGGNYRLNGVPLGKYRIQVWHPELGITETGVELVHAGEVLDVNFDLKNK